MLVTEKKILTEEIEELCKKYGGDRSSLLPILQEVQMKYGHISDFAQQEIARVLDIHPVEVYGVISFYSFLRIREQGKYVIRLCRTISCDIAGKDVIVRTIEKELGIHFSKGGAPETTVDKQFTLEYINCMGMCDQGPAMLVNDVVYTRLTPVKVIEILNKYKK
jgi:[NiFe] hydrogenase diaphorase moiety large subunit